MLKTILKSLREYKKPSVITVFLMIGEVVIECLIPFITGNLVNKIQNGFIGRENAGASLTYLLTTGGLLVLMAVISLACGGAAAFTASKGASGLAKNLRHDIF
jgi:ATP-binding cassette subfamily B protein